MSTMLRKRGRSIQKDSSFSSENHGVHKSRGSPFFTVRGLFVGLSTKNTDFDSSSKSPTSPLDFKAFPFARSPRSPASWDCDRVGLGLVDSLNDGKVLGTSESKSILFGPQMRIQASTPKTCLFNCLKDEDGHVSGSSPNSEGILLKLESVLTAGSLPIDIIGNGNGFMDSEDYTCIISHGPNPKTTHIFGDCILDGESIRSLDYKNPGKIDFLSYCFSCKKKLEQGEDVYIYRGDKAFCSGDCRDQEILTEEKIENVGVDCASSSSFREEIFMAVASQ